MKKRIRASILAAFMCLTLLTTPAFAYDISMTQETLTIENGVFSNESAVPSRTLLTSILSYASPGNTMVNFNLLVHAYLLRTPLAKNRYMHFTKDKATALSATRT